MNDSYHIEELEIRISNYLSGNCTEEEKEALFAYLASNEDAAKIFREMSAVWALLPSAHVMFPTTCSVLIERFFKENIVLLKLFVLFVFSAFCPSEERMHFFCYKRNHKNKQPFYSTII